MVLLTPSYMQFLVTGNMMNANRMALILTLGIGVVILALSNNTAPITWASDKIVLTDHMTSSSLVQSFGNNITYLIGIWMGLLVLGGYVLTHIHFKVLKEEQR